MEYVDVLDQSGNLTGRKVPREEAHQKGLWHRVAHIWVANSTGDVLIQKRSSQKISYPNMWGMACEGHISAGQEPIDGALRELKEELNLNLKPGQIDLIFTYKRSVRYSKTFIGNHFIDVYMAKKDIDLSELTFQEEEVSEIKWISFGEYIDLVKNDKPNFRNYPDELEKISQILNGFGARKTKI
jgi:isopentenyldiphosphate isomerase